MLKVQVIVGSTRGGRNADHVLKWALPVIQAHEGFDVELLDLRDWPLPFFQETLQTIGDPRDPTYSEPLVKRWNAKIKEGDAYVFVTPEYNHSVPGVLKNAIDSVFVSFGFRHKPAAIIAYSNGIGAGIRAIEHLNHILLETEASPLRTPVPIPFVGNAFNEQGKPVNPLLDIGLAVVLDDLAWMGKALKAARAEGEPPPASMRVRQASVKAGLLPAPVTAR